MHADCQFPVLYKWAKAYAISAIEADRKHLDRLLAHEWIRSALGLSEDAPYRFDFYAQEIEKLKADRKRRGEPVARSDKQIVDQTEDLERLLMLEFYSRESPENTLFRNADNPRGEHVWRVACQAQEMLTATDPENAVSELDDAPQPAEPTDKDSLSVAAPVACFKCGHTKHDGECVNVAPQPAEPVKEQP